MDFECQFGSGEIVPDLAALLPQKHQLREALLALLNPVHQKTKDRLVQENSGEKAAKHGGGTDAGLFAELGKLIEKLFHWSIGLGCLRDDLVDLFYLHRGVDGEDVLFARKVVEEGPFADIGGLGNIFDRGLCKTSVREKT